MPTPKLADVTSEWSHMKSIQYAVPGLICIKGAVTTIESKYLLQTNQTTNKTVHSTWSTKGNSDIMYQNLGWSVLVL